MTYLILFIASAIVFLMLDVVMLKSVLFPLFSDRLGDQLLDEPRMAPAVVFYVMYILGTLWFVSIPAYTSGVTSQAFWNGLILGAFAYGTYELTNFATLKTWKLEMVLVDLSWGSVLTALTAWGGVMITRALT